MKHQIHVLADEKLGGIKREYVEVMRKAEVGDKVLVFGHGNEKANGFHTVDKVLYGGHIYYGEFGRIPYGYYVLEPTDIIHIDGKRYRMVDRKAKVGEHVIVTGGNCYLFEIGDMFEVEKTEFIIPAVGLLNGNNVIDGSYSVLEPVEEKLDIYDLLANLSNRVHKLEKEMERQNAFAKEQRVYEVKIDIGDFSRVSKDLLVELKKHIQKSYNN